MAAEMVMLIVGLAVGGIVVWLALRPGIRNAANKARAEGCGRNFRTNWSQGVTDPSKPARAAQLVFAYSLVEH
jgi:hypothetical protein